MCGHLLHQHIHFQPVKGGVRCMPKTSSWADVRVGVVAKHICPHLGQHDAVVWAGAWSSLAGFLRLGHARWSNKACPSLCVRCDWVGQARSEAGRLYSPAGLANTLIPTLRAGARTNKSTDGPALAVRLAHSSARVQAANARTLAVRSAAFLLLAHQALGGVEVEGLATV